VIADARGLVDLSVEQRPLGVEDLEIVGDTAAVAKLGELHHLALGRDPLPLRASLLSRFLKADERVLDFPKRLQERAFIFVDRLSLLGLSDFDSSLVLVRVEDGLQEPREDTPALRRSVE